MILYNTTPQYFFCSFFTVVIHTYISTIPFPLAPYCTYLLELVTGTILQFILVYTLYIMSDVINLFKNTTGMSHLKFINATFITGNID